jgi:hypothetical protein
MPTPRPFTVDPALSAIAIGYKNASALRIADIVLPRAPVSAERFKWTEYPIAEAFNTPDARVSRRGRVNQIEFSGTEQTSSVEDYALDAPVPYTDIEAAARAREQGRTIIDPEQLATMLLTETIENIREVRAASLVFNQATYAAARRVTLSGTSQLSDFTNSDPVATIMAALQGTLVYTANTLVMGREVWSVICRHPRIVNAVKGSTTTGGIVNREQFLELFAGEGVTRLVVGDAWVNTAKPGQAVALARAWGKHIAAIYLNPLAQPEGGMITFGVTAEHGARIAGRIEDPDIGIQGGYRIRAGERVKELVVARDTGYYIQNAVA